MDKQTHHYPRTQHPVYDGAYWIRIPQTQHWSFGRLVGGMTSCPVILGGLSGSAIQLSSLCGAEFAGPVPEPTESEANPEPEDAPVNIRPISISRELRDELNSGTPETEPDEYEDDSHS